MNQNIDLREFLKSLYFSYTVEARRNVDTGVVPGSSAIDKVSLAPDDPVLILTDNQTGSVLDIFPLNDAVVPAVIRRLNVYIQDSVLLDFDEALARRGINAIDLMLDGLYKKCKELGVGDDEVAYEFVECILHPDRIQVPELASGLDDVIKACEGKRPGGTSGYLIRKFNEVGHEEWVRDETRKPIVFPSASEAMAFVEAACRMDKHWHYEVVRDNKPMEVER